MENTSVLGSSLSYPLGSRTVKWAFAKGISIIFSPPLLGLIGIFLIGAQLDSRENWVWIWAYVALNLLSPIGYLLFLMRRGEVRDFHINRRSERTKPLAALLLLSFLSWLIFLVMQAPYFFQVLALARTLQAMAMFLTTLRWKISGHGAGAAGFSVLLWGLYGLAAAPAFLFIPIVIWARVALNRHDLVQTLAGAAVGASSMFSVLVILAGHCSGLSAICA